MLLIGVFSVQCIAYFLVVRGFIDTFEVEVGIEGCTEPLGNLVAPVGVHLVDRGGLADVPLRVEVIDYRTVPIGYMVLMQGEFHLRVAGRVARPEV